MDYTVQREKLGKISTDKRATVDQKSVFEGIFYCFSISVVTVSKEKNIFLNEIISFQPGEEGVFFIFVEFGQPEQLPQPPVSAAFESSASAISSTSPLQKIKLIRDMI